MKAISLFSGCGGSDLGLKMAGIQVEWANDVWRAACETYRANLGGEVVCADIRAVKSFPRADLLSGCYPCQGFSQGGKRDPFAGINFLFEDFARALAQVRPKAFVVENVAGMALGRNREWLQAQVELFHSLGYVVKWRKLDARDYGLAQERKRIFIVGIHHKVAFDYDFPEPTHGADYPDRWRCQGDVIGEFPLWPTEGFIREPLTWYYMSRRRRRDWSEPAPCVVGHARSVALHPVSPEMRRTGPDKYEFAHDGPARRYSYKECAALQGFPTAWNWPTEHLPTRYRLIGNSVPPPLMAAIVRPLVPLLQ